MVERVETTNYMLMSGDAVTDGLDYFYLKDKRNHNLTYFHSINGPWLMRDDLDYDSHVVRRAGRIPDDVDGVVKEQLRNIRDFGEMESPSW